MSIPRISRLCAPMLGRVLPGWGQWRRLSGRHPRYLVGLLPRSLSRARRSFFVGRPNPLSRRGARPLKAGSGGGVRSSQHCAAREADPRLSIRAVTRRILSCPALRTRTSWPMRSLKAALTRCPSTWTCPPRQPAVASERVLYTRVAQSHVSIR